MKISILTLFPEMFSGPFDYSIIKKAQEKKLVEIEFINLRDFGLGKHQIVDHPPYGGGGGMVFRVDVLEKAIEHIKSKNKKLQTKVVLMDARGTKFTQKTAFEFSKLDHLIIVAGHYEGFDERINNFVDLSISIGDFVLTGGEIPAMAVIDAVTRLIPGVIKEGSLEIESFSASDLSKNILEYPQYTKPQVYKKLRVPKILLSGNHQKIEKWRTNKSVSLTKKIRPDLLKRKLG